MGKITRFLIIYNPVADASAYKQFGNSVAVPAIHATGKEIIKRILVYVDRK